MLGIDYQNIKGDFFNGARERIFNTSADFTSYNLLEMILENSDKVVENDNDKNIRAKFINYYKSQIKRQLITLYKNIIYKYNLINKINILGDYENILNLQSNEEKNLARVRK